MLRGLCDQVWVSQPSSSNASNASVSLGAGNSPPSLSTCIQETLLVWFPFAYLVITLPVYAWSLRKSQLGTVPVSPLSITKQILNACLMGCGLVTLGFSIWSAASQNADLPWHTYLSPVIQLLTIIMVAFTVEWERRKGTRSSVFLLLFWFLILFSGFLTLWSQAVIQQWESAMARWCLNCIFYGLSFIQMLLSIFPDKIPVGGTDSIHNYEIPNPYYFASSFTKLALLYAFSLIRVGYRKSLEITDLWNLTPEYLAKNQLKKFQKFWNAELEKSNRSMWKHETSKSQFEEFGIPLLHEEKQEKAKKEPEVLIKSAKSQAQSKRKPSLIKAIFLTYLKAYASIVFLRIVVEVFVFINPILIRKIIHFIDDHEATMWDGVLYAVAFLMVQIVQNLIQHNMNNIMFNNMIKRRNAIMSAIYHKALKLSSSARKDTTIGEIVNLMAVDTLRYNDLIHYVNIVWVLPLQVGFALYFLWGILGASALAGLTVFIFQAPLNFFIGRLSKRLQSKQMKFKDERIKLTNEVLNGMKVLKLYAWELSFEAQVKALRTKELRVLRIQGFLNAISHFIFSVSPALIALLSFAAYVFSSDDHILTSEKAFVSISYFNILRGPIQNLPQVINSMIQCNVSHNRIYKFLLKEELDPDAIIRNKDDKEHALKIENASFGWSSDEKPLLRNIQLTVKPGSTVAIVGTVGAGKSSILSAVMGEMHKFRGTISLNGEVAYVPQQAWIQQATLRNNVLFHSPPDEEYYQKVLDICALRPDLDILPGGDKVEIGEKGINLSGGQKLRVSLARAVYQKADLYLLDDPLSAVDAHVGKKIFEEVLGPQGILKDKAKIIVTHSLWFLPQVDEIYVIEEGCIKEHGSFADLMSRGGSLVELMKVYNAANEAAAKEKDSETEVQLDKHSLENPSFLLNGRSDPERKRQRTFSDSLYPETNQEQRSAVMRQRSVGYPSSPVDDGKSTRLSRLSLSRSIRESTADISSQLSLHTSNHFPESPLQCPEVTFSEIFTEDEDEDPKKKKEKPQKEIEELIEAEEVATGKVKMDVYTSYLKAIGLGPGMGVILLAIVAICLDIGAYFWLSGWSDLMGQHAKLSQAAAMNFTGLNETAIPVPEPINQQFYISIFALLSILSAISQSLRQAVGILAGLRTSKVQHNRLLRAILRAPMEFFDRTPLGRILNRFSSDVAVLDTVLHHLMIWLMVLALELIGSMILIGIVTPWSLLAWILLGAVFFWIQNFYVTAQRQCRRLLSVSKSPVYAHFGESLAGMSTIRAYGRQELFLAECQDRIDQWGRCSYFSLTSNRWLGVVLNFFGALLVFVAALLMVSLRDSLTPGQVGLAMAYAAEIVHLLIWTVELATSLESEAISLERLTEYSSVKSEAPWEVESHQSDPAWPQTGSISIQKLSNRYRAGLELVLKGITCDIKAAEKIGVVGRTGAGKSSLTLSLFRLLEAADGAVIIDGLDISKLGLHDLRSKLTVIPQDPVLFSGTLRMNLDPFDKYTDQQIWSALSHAHLADWVKSLPAALEYKCSEGGENLSIGQRQLVCLARALLRKTKVLILDEATAACDVETDELIQATIRSEFAKCTVLTVAHRLNTIMDYDRIMVLSAGRILELDSPKALLANPSSMFYSLAKDAGLVEK